MLKVCTFFLTTAFVIAVSTDIASGETFLTVPRSSVVVIRDGVELNCSINGNDTLTWMFTSWNTSNETTIYLGRGIIDSFNSRYSIDNRISGQHNLIINSADKEHAGRYVCRTVTAVQAAAQLTVLDTVQKCWINTSSADQGIMEHDYLWMCCRVIYTGNMIPIFTWTKSSTKNPIAANITTSDKLTLPLTTTSSVIAQLSADDNGAIFKCKITFQLPNNTKGNAPDYEYTWNYTANVLYGPRNLSITRYGDRFECSAVANPTPMYKWTDVETNTSTEGSTFMLHDIAASEKAYTLQCTAVNAIATVNKNITGLPLVKDSGTGSWKEFLITSAAIAGPVFFLLIIVVIICCVVRRKRLKGNTSARPDVALETDINSYVMSSDGFTDDIDVSSGPSPNGVRDGNSSRGRSNDSKIADNLVYAEVKKPKGTREEKRATNDQPSAIYADVKKKVNVNGSSTGRSGANLGENPQPSQTPNPGNKNCIGDDGTVYAELGEMKQQPTNKVQSAKPPVFSQVEIYASIDHRGNVPPPPPKL